MGTMRMQCDGKNLGFKLKEQTDNGVFEERYEKDKLSYFICNTLKYDI